MKTKLENFLEHSRKKTKCDILDKKKVIVGLDMSLASPGIAVFFQQECKWELFAFAQKVREAGFFKQLTPNVTMRLLTAIPSAQKASNVVRYKHIVDHIMKFCLLPHDVSLVNLEAYAFPKHEIAGHTFKLHELGGVLKLALHCANIHNVVTIPPNQWKSIVLGKGKGRATKLDVVNHVKTAFPYVDLMASNDYKLNEKGEVPCPVQDIADAICLCKVMDQIKIKKE